jgi:hypothetical protein
MKLRPVLGSFLIVMFCATLSIAQNEKELVIKTARALEIDPKSSSTIKMTGPALQWVIETDQVSIIACGGVFSLFSDKKNKNASDMTVAYTIGMAAFKLENPSQAKDENAAQLAGLDTALKNYEALVKDKPKTKFGKVDALREKRDKGELAAIVNAADCGKK